MVDILWCMFYVTLSINALLHNIIYVMKKMTPSSGFCMTVSVKRNDCASMKTRELRMRTRAPSAVRGTEWPGKLTTWPDSENLAFHGLIICYTEWI